MHTRILEFQGKQHCSATELKVSVDVRYVTDKGKAGKDELQSG